ncbi:MAG TPA: hypothetical protein VN719_09620 [Gemmatimonadales bacterium]|nr:hypothetical protein [Gemmatimonadales bacterium]
MDLARLSNQPVEIVVAGQPLLFGELTLEGIARLQAWVKEHVPHPLRALQGQLVGFSESEKSELLRQAREDAKAWPPQIGTRKGNGALLSTEEGQIAALTEALKVHQPIWTDADGKRLYRQLERWGRKHPDQAEATLRRIYAIAFGVDDPEAELDEELEGEASDPKA